MIEVQHLSKKYGSRWAIKDLNFSVERNEVLGFLGPNAAGKTTTMRIITGFLAPTSGTVLVDGLDVSEEPLKVKRKIGYLPENPPLYNDMVVESVLEFACEIRDVPAGKRAQAVEQALEKAALKEVRGRLIGHLSKGYRQRVGIAQALVHDPDLLILDEPTVGLDPKQIIEIRELIKSLGQSHTVILSTHILSEASALCPRIIVINEGKSVAVDSQKSLSRRLAGADRVLVEVKGPRDEVIGELRRIPGIKGISAEPNGKHPRLLIDVPHDADIRESVFFAMADKGWPILELRKVAMSLEEVFLKLTASESDKVSDVEAGSSEKAPEVQADLAEKDRTDTGGMD
ncbi:MAG: ATP-binding cassette domain-containing protein [Armatimonadetes bacterium]|nr:ATP-binding cassette domain-containing protein [Armatimonadota bacterium]